MKCPYCGKKRIWRKGKRPSTHGEKQRYICRDCGKQFESNTIKRMRRGK